MRVRREVKERYFSTSRQFTGTPWLHRGYVYDRETGKVVVACPHRHYSQGSAERCGRTLLGRFRRELQAAVVHRETPDGES